MREILFRAKRVDNGEWVYGDLRQYINLPQYDDLPVEDLYSIDTMPVAEDYGHNYTVDKTTIGQYTGLPDRNGNKIFEGDILVDNDGESLYVCVFDNGQFGFYTVKEYANSDFAWYNVEFVTDICTILGNIYDNPELIRSK